MPGFTLVFRRRYAMAHRLRRGSEACAIPHGHTEMVTVRVRPVRAGPLDGAANMVEPFERAKGAWHAWIDRCVDHALQLDEADPLVAWFAANEPHRLPRLLLTPGDPTTELLCACFLSKANAFLAAAGGHLRCAGVTVRETPTNSVTLTGDAERALPAGAPADGWWTRADDSINDRPA